MRFLRRSLVGLFLLAVTLGGLTFAGQMIVGAVQDRLQAGDRARPARERVFTANVVSVEVQDFRPVLKTFGEIRSRRTLDLRAKTAGTVVELTENFEDGAQVQAGQLLFRIDPADAQSAVDTAQANLREAEIAVRDSARDLELSQADLDAALDQARLRETALERQRSLLKSGFGSAAQVEEAEIAAGGARQAVVSRRQAQASAQTRADQASAQLLRTQIALDEAQRRLDDTSVFAEFDGNLSDVNLVRGGLVANNEQVARLIDANQLEVSFRISTSQYARLLGREGALTRAPVRISLETFGTELVATGRVTRESASVGEGQTGRLLFAQLDTTAGFLPGDFVRVEVDEPVLSNVAVLPATAIDAAETVLVIGAEERLEQVQVEVLRRQGDNDVVRARGLAGREVVAERTPLLGAGIKVRPVRPNTTELAAAEPEMIELSPERRAALIAFVEGNQRMPEEAKKRVLATLAQDRVPARTVERIESRMGG